VTYKILIEKKLLVDADSEEEAIEKALEKLKQELTSDDVYCIGSEETR
jgi:hypothetical protein